MLNVSAEAWKRFTTFVKQVLPLRGSAWRYGPPSAAAGLWKDYGKMSR
jgi:hypothetical protein